MAREMKDSGVKWIGTIPQNWLCARLKDIKSSQKYAIVDGPFGSAISTSDYVDEGIPLVRILNLGTPNILTSDLMHITEEHAETIQRSRFGIGDIIFAKTGATIGKCAINDSIEYGILSSSCVKITLNPCHNAKFYYYFFFTQQFNDALKDACVGTTRDTINLSPFSCLPCVIPPTAEQLCIATFLDRKCAEIDQVVAETEKTIEEYKALRQSIITEAVTKGIRGKRPMKESGIEWIGEIPEEWAVQRIKTIFTLRDERNYRPLEEVNLISLYTDLGVVQHSDLENTTGNKASNADGYKLVYENDIVVNIILCWMGAIGRSAYCGVTSPAYDVYSPSDKIDCRFYHHYFRTTGFSGDCYKRGRGIMAMRWRTYSDQFRDIKVVVPPLQEQEEILDYLDIKCAEIDCLISSKQQLLTELESYKKSVIYEYVTGKKEVPVCQ